MEQTPTIKYAKNLEKYINYALQHLNTVADEVMSNGLQADLSTCCFVACLMFCCNKQGKK